MVFFCLFSVIRSAVPIAAMKNAGFLFGRDEVVFFGSKFMI